jgi:hypothetical protein
VTTAAEDIGECADQVSHVVPPVLAPSRQRMRGRDTGDGWDTCLIEVDTPSGTSRRARATSGNQDSALPFAPLALALSLRVNPWQAHVRSASEGRVAVPVEVGNPWEGSHYLSPQA